MAPLLTLWAVAAAAVAFGVARAIHLRDQQIPRADDGPPECRGCSCALCPDCEPEDTR